MATIENRGPQLQAVCILFLIMALISCSLRAFVRAGMVKVFGLDDWAMAFATVTFVMYCACALTGIHYGTGRHEADLAPQDVEKALLFWYLCYCWYCWTMIFSKISIGVFMLRIVIKKVHVWAIWLALSFSVITALAFFFTTVFQCHPVSYFWNREQPGGCIPMGVLIGLAFLYSSLNVVCDFTFALLPVFIVAKLRLSRHFKIAIIPLLGMGCLASCAVAVRLAYLEKFKNPDFLWATTDIAIWSTVEQGLTITTGSLACLRPLFATFSQRLGITSVNSSGVFAGSASGDGPSIEGSGSKSTGSRRYGGSRDMFSLSTHGDHTDDQPEQNISGGQASTAKYYPSGESTTSMSLHHGGVRGPDHNSGQFQQ